jgi:hypothetical protein
VGRAQLEPEIVKAFEKLLRQQHGFGTEGLDP